MPRDPDRRRRQDSDEPGRRCGVSLRVGRDPSLPAHTSGGSFMQPTDSTGERSLSPWWRHGALLVMIFGFSVLTVVTVFTYSNAPPIPRQVVDPAGHPLFSGEEIERGQEVFLERALM